MRSETGKALFTKDSLVHEHSINLSNKDYYLGCLAGLLSGLLSLPVLKSANFGLYSKYGFFIVPVFIVGTITCLAIAKYISNRYVIIWEIGKFGIIGILNTFVDFGFLTIMTIYFRNYFNIDSNVQIIYGIPVYSVYKFSSFALAVVNSYYWNKQWTFSEGVSQKSGTDFFQFLLVSMIGCGINVGVSTYIFSLMIFGMFNIDQQGLLGAGFGSFLGLGWNFLGYKFIVFKKLK
jgi:putative flippase GtrA